MYIHSATRSLLFQAPDPGVILGSMPSRVIAGESFNVATKHTEAATLALRKMGFKAPSPIVSYYNWPKFKGLYAPFDHQRSMAEFATLHWRHFNLSEMGTAKTNAALWAADYLMTIGKVKKTLIVSPLSTLNFVWMEAIYSTLMHRSGVVVHGDRAKRKQALAMDVDFYVINHEGLCIKEIRDIINKRPDINLVIVDEGSKFRNHQTDKYKALQAVVGLPSEPVHNRGLWWLTGTPTPNAPLDAYAQARLVNRDFKMRYGAFRDLTMIEVGEHIWKPKHNGYKHAFEAMQPAIRFEKKDCLDLPPMVTEDRFCEMTADQTRAYKAMTKDFVAEMKSGIEVKAVNAADRINKLRQIALGCVKAGEDDYQPLDAGPRFQELVEAIGEAQAKVYVIVPYKGAIRTLNQMLRAKGISCAFVNGDVPASQRNRIFAEFKNQTNPKVLLCHPAVVAHGLDFTVADMLVFYGPIYSNDEYRQVVERFNRPGQTRKMTVIRLSACALEQAIYKMPDDRELTQSALLKLYRTALSITEPKSEMRMAA